MPLRAASEYALPAGYDLNIATLGKQSVEELDQRLADVSNSLHGSYSAINNASRALAAELSPTLKEAWKHEKAARTQIEKVLGVFHTNLPELATIVGQLNEGRLRRDGFKEGKALSKEAKKLHSEMFAASDTLIMKRIIGNKTAEDALAHAETLATQLENSLN